MAMGGKADELWKGFSRADDTMAQTYVIERGGIYYLVWESFTNDRSLLAIPVRRRGASLTFNRILSFGRSFGRSSSEQRDVRVGTEFQIANEIDVANFTWSDANKLVARLHRSISSPNAQAATDVAIPGFQQTLVTVYSPNGKFIKARRYIDSIEAGWSISSTTCFIGCDAKSRDWEGAYTGAIGNLPITMDLTFASNQASGTYSYNRGNGNLYLVGAISSNGLLSLKESESKGAIQASGSFVATFRDGSWRGSWTSKDGKRALPFFAIASGL